MAEPKYLLVPQVFGTLCKGCYLRNKRAFHCVEFMEREFGKGTFCHSKVVIENTDEAKAAFVAAKLEKSNGE